MAERKPYLRCQRHLLLDLHVPDWEDRFLAEFDPAAYVELCVEAGADAVMVYCNSHAGQCYWPTASGRQHANLAGRDIVGECVEMLHERGIAVCAYYSAIFNNWAYAEHPEWRLVASAPGGILGPGTRYGQCCPANFDYVDFMLRQTGELVDDYPFDAFFYDMVFWPDVCVCASCRRRFREEAGEEMPTVVDWHDPAWCRFQAARERWLADCFGRLRGRVRESLPVPVFLNSALIEYSWIGGSSEELLELNDLLGGDFEERGVFDVSAGATRSLVQYMWPISGYGGGLSDLRPLPEQIARGFTSVAFGAQFMAIDAAEPDGRVNPLAYERLAAVFDAIRPYEEHLGGRPLADVGVYHSSASHVGFAENGTPLDALGPGAPVTPDCPHWRAVTGALEALGRAHLPAAVLTRADLERLREYPVVVLPNVLRMDAEEIDACREYVAAGGRLYASGYTSLVGTGGERHGDFPLADLFGASFAGEATEEVSYLRLLDFGAGAETHTPRYVPVGEPFAVEARLRPVPAPTVLRVDAHPAVEALATVTLPYAGGRGSRDDRDWANIHSAPPWEDTPRAAIVRHRYGAGEVVYSAVDLEAAAGRLAASSRALFLDLVRGLLGRRPTVAVEAHPNLLMTAFHEPEHRRYRLCLLNAMPPPALPLPRVDLSLAAPDGSAFTALRRLPGGEQMEFELSGEGRLHAAVTELEAFEMLAASYEPD